ncbi:Lysophospholipase [Phaffia rhodozyma]|uniref:Acyl-protein thioesterase 1 n=1 Tax=Phaffia rhodozyma TaxID=264483 RepID=A0A0F7SFF5_PHARH|nr:Lysophospholipase [Phaffia rhodozyma]
MSPLTFQTLAPTAKHTATIIFSHGLGDQGASWLPMARMLAPALPYVKWVFPNAPEIPITLNNGHRMPGWFDLSSLEKLGDPREEDEKGLVDSADAIQAIISREGLAVGDNRIVVGGFSQGCVVSILAGLTKGTQGKEKEVQRALAGVVGLSGWLPLRDTLKERFHAEAKNLPIFWGHGTADQVVGYKYGQQSVEILISQYGLEKSSGQAGKGIQFESYPGLGHGSSPQELKDLSAWLQRVIPTI